MGVESATPRMTYTGPLVKDKVAITESLEYRFVRTPVTSLPPLERDQKLEGFNSYTQLDFNISNKQTATVSVAVYPQKLEYMGLNTFTPQPSTADYHQRGYQIYGQHRYLTGPESALTSQISYKTYDADTTPEGNWRLSAADRHHPRGILQPAEQADRSFRLAGELCVCPEAIPWIAQN